MRADKAPLRAAQRPNRLLTFDTASLLEETFDIWKRLSS